MNKRMVLHKQKSPSKRTLRITFAMQVFVLLTWILSMIVHMV